MSDRYVLGEGEYPWADAVAPTAKALREKMKGGGPFKLMLSKDIPWSEVEDFFIDPEYPWPAVEDFWQIYFGLWGNGLTLEHPTLDEVKETWLRWQNEATDV